MNRRKLLSAYSLKWNPFAPDIPPDAIHVNKRLERFAWQLEEMTQEGGFALVTGEVGQGKSVALRHIQHRLSQSRDLQVMALARPQSSVADFYRELGETFGAEIRASNRWGGFRTLREKWRAKLESSLRRPVLLIDEAQEMQAAVLSEIRILSSDRLDSENLLTVVLCGDPRLTAKLSQDDLLPVASRVRARLERGALDAQESAEALRHALTVAGNPTLMTDGVIQSLAEHSMGNYRMLMNFASELLVAGLGAEAPVIDEKFHHEHFGGRIAPKPGGRRRRASSA